MKYPILFALVLSIAACQNSPEEAAPTSSSVTEPIPQTTAAPPETSATPRQLFNELRTALRMQLANTLPEQKEDRQAAKSYSLKMQENGGRPTWIIKEKWFDANTNQIFAGADFMLLWTVVDVSSIQLINSPDGSKTGIQIKPTMGNTFLYHPYSNEPDVAVVEAFLGWYDHSQDATLQRILVQMQQLAGKMQQWQF